MGARRFQPTNRDGIGTPAGRRSGSSPAPHRLYIGVGNIIDAPHTGAPVRIDSVWSFGNYASARRYLPS